MSERICEREWCVNAFTGRSDKRFCSDRCSKNLPPAWWRQKQRGFRECKYDKCANSFSPENSKRVFCSNVCSIKHNSEKRYKDPVRGVRPVVPGNGGISTVYKILRKYGIRVSRETAHNGFAGPMRIEVVEAKNALTNGIFTENEYAEELRAIADKYVLPEQEVMDYARSVHVQPIDFHPDYIPYGPTRTTPEDFYVDLPELSLT